MVETNRRNGRSVSALAVLSCIVMLIGSCDLLQTGTGTIEVRVYSEAWDPADIQPGANIEPIVEIDPPIGGRSLFVGDDLGFVTVSDVPVGTYTVRAPFLGAGYESTVEVVGREGAKHRLSTSFRQSSNTTA